jgi:Domain of Unknown Function with PDB structure (DUF3857)/Transglutaminase-like superfamily
MRVRLLTCAVLCLGVTAIPTFLWGQFQPSTPEELKMTSDPKAPGADAVYLNIEETADDMLHFHSQYARIKVLTEKGKEMATISVPYPKGKFTVDSIRGRTIHADGTIISLSVKPTDLVEAKGKDFQYNKMVFTLPSAEVGSILEYRLEIRYEDNWVVPPDWMVMQPYFVHKAHYSFLPIRDLGRVEDAGKLTYSAMLPPGVKVASEASGRLTLDVTDVPAIPDEEYMPPLESVLEQVQFYYTRYLSNDEFWKHEGDHWSKEADRFANPGKGLKEAVSGIVAPTDSEEVKARKIYDAVMALNNTDYTRRKSSEELKQQHLKEAKDAEDVWKQKSGSSDEIALLYLGMVRAAGLKARAFAVRNRNRGIFNSYFMSMRQLDDDLVTLTINGKDTNVDPGTKFAPFGSLHWKHTLTGGIRQTDKGIELASTSGNPYKEASTTRVADLTIAEDGSVTGTVRFTMTGPAALRWRQLALESDVEEVKKQFNEHMRGTVPDGVDAEFDHFLGLDDYHSVLMGIVKISGNLGTQTGKRVFLPGVFFESQAKHPFIATEKRLTPVDMHYAETINDEVTYHLPEHFTVESAPAATSVPWPGQAAFGLKAVLGDRQVVVGRSFARAFALVAAKDYSALHDFYQKVATADQQQLVLTATPAPPAKAGGQ